MHARSTYFYGYMAISLASIALFWVSPELAAQQPDGSTYGMGAEGQRYFDELEDTFLVRLCPIVDLLRWLAAGLGTILSFWMLYKAARGDHDRWLTAFIILLVASMLWSPASLFEFLGINVPIPTYMDCGGSDPCPIGTC